MNLEPAGSTRQGSVNNRIRGRFNAWLFEALDDYMHARLGPAKTRLFAGVPGTVVEIGPGSGANLRYLPRGTHVIAIEPNLQILSACAGARRTWVSTSSFVPPRVSPSISTRPRSVSCSPRSSCAR